MSYDESLQQQLSSVYGSCDPARFAPTEQELNDIAFRGNVPPPEKIQAMKDYARNLKIKYPQMSEKRIMRKTAEYFKVKITS